MFDFSRPDPCQRTRRRTVRRKVVRRRAVRRTSRPTGQRPGFVAFEHLRSPANRRPSTGGRMISSSRNPPADPRGVQALFLFALLLSLLTCLSVPLMAQTGESSPAATVQEVDPAEATDGVAPPAGDEETERAASLEATADPAAGGQATGGERDSEPAEMAAPTDEPASTAETETATVDSNVALATPKPARPLGTADLEAFIDGWMAAYLDEAPAAGGVVSVVRGEELLLAKGYGYSDVAARQPVSASETLFRIGSVSKLFVWTAVMQEVEAGRLDLDSDITTWLDALQIPDNYSQPITLRHLLTHTPGFEDHVVGLFDKKDADRSIVELLEAQMPDRVGPPGQLASYSNHGTALAMHLVERVSGLHWREYIDRNILEPLGMASTTFEQPPPANVGTMSQGYQSSDGDFLPKEFEFVPLAPAGAVSASATDMARFSLGLARRGCRHRARCSQWRRHRRSRG